MLKKNQIDEMSAKMRDTDADQIIIENLVKPMFVARMKRYGDVIGEVFKNFNNVGKVITQMPYRVDTTFTRAEAFELTKVVLDYLLKSQSTEIDLKSEKEEKPRGYG
jgi:hypothetical protein